MKSVISIKEIPIRFPSKGPYLPTVLKTILSLEKDKGMNLYFRGEPKKYPYVIPSLYRKDNEKLVFEGSETYYRRLLSELGKDDYNESAELARMMAEFRHFGAITRIIDISKNPLASLYFAVESHDDEPGFIYVFASDSNVPNYYNDWKKEKYDTGHTIAIKTAMNLISQADINNFISACNVLMRCLFVLEDAVIAKDMIYEYDLPTNQYFELAFTDMDMLLKRFSDMFDEGGSAKGRRFEKEHIDRLIARANIIRFMNLLNQRAKVREELKYPFHIYFDLCRAHLFIPSMNTIRISRQRGAFIYPAYVNTKIQGKEKTIDVIQKEIQDSIFEFLYPKAIGNTIQIPKCFKSELRNELYQLGIDGGFLYADINHQSEALISNL